MPDDTIVAIATPPGRGGIGVVRISGGLACGILRQLLVFPHSVLPRPREVAMAQFKDPETGRLLDRALVTCFPKPHSYTGEDVVEISCHGAPVILRYLVECCLAKGARPAEPGEFTLRAFLNGRIDLTQAEAIRDLIDSRTLYQARVAARQMEGSVSARVKPSKEALLGLIAELEAGIDFAEDDVPVAGRKILAGIDRVQARLVPISEGYAYGRIIREGISLAIVGRPNVGKSSLFNRLLNEERAIVTEIPGTTRDLVSETASFNGIPVRLVDTAGIRESRDVVEKAGIERSLEALADSDLRLLVLDASAGLTSEDEALFRRIQPCGPWVIACNKCDLPIRLTVDSVNVLREKTAAPALVRASVQSHVREPQPWSAPQQNEGPEACSRNITAAVWTSALTGEGLAELKAKIIAKAAPVRDADPESEFITSLRQQQSLEQCLRALAAARDAAVHTVPHEMLLLDLYEALHALDALTGATTTDDVLGVIFSTFCVGK